MSKEADKYKVFQTTRVRTALKKDGSWIHKSKQEDDEQEKAREDHNVESRPSPSRQNSYVFNTAKKYESADSPLSPPLLKTQFALAEGYACAEFDSANQANVAVIPPQKDAQPEGSTVETTDDAKPQAPTEELIQNGEVRPEESVVNTTAENKEEYTAVCQSIVEHNAQVSPEVHVTEQIQNGEVQPDSSTKENPEALFSNATAENKGECADATVEHPNTEHSEAKFSADACVGDPAVETPAAPVAELKPKEEPTETEPVSAAVQVSVDSFPNIMADTESKTAVKSVECKVKSAASAKPVDNMVVKQSVEPIPDIAGDQVVKSEDATEPPTASDAQDTFSDRLIKLSDALDVGTKTTEADLETLEDSQQSHTEETKQLPDDANTSDMFQKSKNEQLSRQTQRTRKSNVCSLCEKIINGNVKLHFSEPVMTCHPECLKCGVCAQALGEMLIPMFLHNQMVQCGGCFVKTRI